MRTSMLPSAKSFLAKAFYDLGLCAIKQLKIALFWGDNRATSIAKAEAGSKEKQ